MYKYQAVVAFAIVLAFIIPGSAAFANVENETLGVIVSETSEPLTTDWWPKFHHDLANTGYSTSTAPGTPINSVSKETDSLHVRALSDDLLIPSDIINNANTINAGPPPGFYDTSEYMIGSVAVGVLFLESNGLGEPSTETWTLTEETQVTIQIQQGLSWWRARNPSANVNFVYDWNYRVPVSIEPINNPSVFTNPSWEERWVDESMAYLGFSSGDRFARTRSYLNNLRTNRGTDWSFAVFVIDSSNDPDGMFSDGYYAEGYLGGPFIVMTYDNDGYGIDRMDYVTAHETGHIFYATDEYNNRAEYSGYLNVLDNDNVSSCVMKSYSWVVCEATRQQIGWRDSDGDGIQDIVDTNPETTLTPYSPDPTSDDTPTYTGTSTVVPYTNNNPWGPGNDVSINTISNVRYRVDGGTSNDATASDGAFNGYVEGYTFTTSSLSRGTHTIEAYSINSVGNLAPTPASDTITIDNAPNAPSRPSGQISGNIGVSYPYSSSTIDPDGDQVYYQWDWGDGTNSGWLGPFASGAQVSAQKSWSVKGSYSIQVRARDTFGAESPWSDPLPITMPYSFNRPIQQFLELLFQRFPHAFPILRHLLGY